MAVEPQDIGAGQRLVSTVGVALDAQPLGDDGTEDLLHLIHVVGEGHVLTVVFVNIPQGQGQVTQHLKLTPSGQRQHVLQIAVDDTIIIRFVGFFNIIEVLMVKFLSRHVDGADDKVQRRGILHQMLRPLKAHGGLSQLRSQPQGGDGQNAAAAAQVQHPLTAVNPLIQRRQAQPGGGVGACAEGKAGVQDQRHPSGGQELLHLRVLLKPLGDHHQMLPDLHGLVILLPVVLPVGVLEVLQRQQQRPAVVPLGLELLQGQTDFTHLGKALLAGFQVEGDAGLTGHLGGKVLVHIVPVLVVVLQKVLELCLVVDHHAVDAQGGEQRLHRLQSGVGGVNVQLQPIHILSPFQRLLPTKNSATVPGPEWLPITGPT